MIVFPIRTGFSNASLMASASWFRNGKRVRLLSRNKKLINNTYPELVDEYKKQPNGSFIADGEVVAFQGRITSFSRLQGRKKITDPDEEIGRASCRERVKN